MDQNRDAAPAPPSPVATATQTEPETPPPQLTLQDLQSVLLVIDSACQRGAFKASEMRGIGDLHDKISAYVKHSSKQ